MASDPAYIQDYYNKYLKAEPPQFSRKCHDCGKPCNDYRCKQCWTKLRSRLDVPAEVDDMSYSASILKDDTELPS